MGAQASGTMKEDEHVLPEMFDTGSADTGQKSNAGAKAPVFNNPAGDARITRTVKWSLSSAFIVMDQNRLGDVNVGQLTDYIGMFAFAPLIRSWSSSAD